MKKKYWIINSNKKKNEIKTFLVDLYNMVDIKD